MWPRQLVVEARRLRDSGFAASAIARQLGVPRSTVRDWLAGRTRGPRPPAQPVSAEDLVRNAAPSLYAYLLGLYLGDGYLATAQRGVYCLRVYLDSRYPDVIASAAAAAAAVMPRNRVGVVPRRGSRCVIITCSSRHWPTLFPQHGVGRKHSRVIELAAWQRAITHSHPKALLRGLIHSDGCRFIARQRRHGRVYHYARYDFTNRSDDIREIFVEHLDLLGIDWTRPGRFKIQIARREAVAAMDRFIGPKS